MTQRAKCYVAAASVCSLLLCSSATLSAQMTCTSGTGVIQGTVRDDSTGAAVGGSWVALLFPFCRVVTDAAGRFRFERLPAATIRIDAGQEGYRRFRPVEVTVATGQTTEVELRLRPGGPIQDCRIDAGCAPLLQEPMVPTGTEEEQFRYAAHATTIAIAWSIVGREPRWYACVEEKSPVVLAELTSRYGYIAPATDCAYRTFERERLAHVPTGSAAFRINVGQFEETAPGRRRVELSYAIAGLWAAGWRCDFERVPGAWRPVLCVGRWEA